MFRITITRQGGVGAASKRIHPHLALVQIFNNPQVISRSAISRDNTQIEIRTYVWLLFILNALSRYLMWALFKFEVECLIPRLKLSLKVITGIKLIRRSA